MMKKASIVCTFVAFLLSMSSLMAQTPLTASRLDLTKAFTVTGPKGTTYPISSWSLKYLNSNHLAFVSSTNTQPLSMTLNNVTLGVPLQAPLGITTTLLTGEVLVVNQKIGIGTSPSESLDIGVGVAKANGFVLESNSADVSSWGGVWYGLSKSITGLNLNSTGSSSVLLQGRNGLGLRTANGSITMSKAGVVTIGLDDSKISSITANTDNTHEYSLYVSKGIRAESSRVDLKVDWPDYVFDTDYKLTPLSELEAFIEKNHHLPNVPSASTVKEEGIDLGDMDARLLEKVEELTLYIIELKKEVEALKNDKKQ